MQVSDVEDTQGLKDTSLLLDCDRKEEIKVKQTLAQDKIDILKQEISLDERESKGIILFENGHVTIHDEECSTVLSESGNKEYTVNKLNGTCTCKDHEFARNGTICKHRISDKLARAAQDGIIICSVVTFAGMVAV